MPDNPGDSGAISGEVVSAAFDGPGEWVTPTEAARRIGISERTLWRRVSAGLWRKQTRSGKAEIYVPLAGGVPTAVENAENRLPATPDSGLTLAVVAELRHRLEVDGARIVEQAEQIGALKAERDAAVRQAAEARAEAERLRRRGWWARLMNALE